MSRLKHTVYAEALLQRHADIFRPHLATVGLDEGYWNDRMPPFR